MNIFYIIKNSNFYKRYFSAARKSTLAVIMYFISGVSLYFFYAVGMTQLNPVVALADMSEKQGVVVNVTGRGVCGRHLFLDSGGEILKYRACVSDEEEKKMMGRVITVWSQNEVGGIFNRRDSIKQIELDGVLIQDYSKIIVRAKRTYAFVDSMLKVIFFFVVFPLVVVWLRMRKVSV